MSVEDLHKIALYSGEVNFTLQNFDSGSETGMITFPSNGDITIGDPVRIKVIKNKWWQKFLNWLFPRQFIYYEDVVTSITMDSGSMDTFGVYEN